MSDLLLTFYGDDFTGSTDSLESLAARGVRTALFFDPPDPSRLRGRFADLRAVGVAGTSRTFSPGEMDAVLPPLFEKLRALGAPILHYKHCSTFDSSPEVGSIGRAIEIGRRVCGPGTVPLLVGAPPLRRYTLFGNLFASADGVTYRIDRHPTMSRHPVTPMDEGDLRRHLARQTSCSVALMDILQLSGAREEVDARFRSILESRPDVVLFDVLDDARLAETGRLIWNLRSPFAAGSSGMGYALTTHWRESGLIPPPASFAPAGEADRLLVVSGSCSPVTRAQIDRALAAGFEEVSVDVPRLLDGPGESEAVDAAMNALSENRSVVVHSARGPDDPRIRDARSVGAKLSEALGRILRTVVQKSGLRRAVVCGGDTSGIAARQLRITALEMIVPLPGSPGAPLCRAASDDPEMDGLEIALKSGQLGGPDYFTQVLRGA